MAKKNKTDMGTNAPEVGVLYERCAGIDVHKEKISVCLLLGNKKEIREYGTMTVELLECIE